MSFLDATQNKIEHLLETQRRGARGVVGSVVRLTLVPDRLLLGGLRNTSRLRWTSLCNAATAFVLTRLRFTRSLSSTTAAGKFAVEEGFRLYAFSR